jgi:hypothetical protein
VTAEFGFDDPNSQVAARLLDVAPDGMQTLVARGLWRPEPGQTGKQAFQLHPGAWTFEQGHVAKLELLPADADTGALGSYGRPSDGQQTVEISRLALRLPVVENPGESDGFIDATTRKPLSEDDELAPGFERLFRARARLAKGPLRRQGRNLRARVKCPSLFAACTDGAIVVKAKHRRGRSLTLASGEFAQPGGSETKVKLKLSKRAHRWLKRHDGSRVRVKTSSGERRGVAKQKRRVRR